MKRAEIDEALRAKVAEYDIGHLCEWVKRPSTLRIVVSDEIFEVSTKAGMSKRNLMCALASIDTIARFVFRRRAKRAQTASVERLREHRQMDIEELTA